MMEAQGRSTEVSEHRKAWGREVEAEGDDDEEEEEEGDRLLAVGRNLRMALRFSHELLLLLPNDSSSAGLVSSTSVPTNSLPSVTRHDTTRHTTHMTHDMQRNGVEAKCLERTASRPG
jgi:hypothetical protein